MPGIRNMPEASICLRTGRRGDVRRDLDDLLALDADVARHLAGVVDDKAIVNDRFGRRLRKSRGRLRQKSARQDQRDGRTGGDGHVRPVRARRKDTMVCRSPSLWRSVSDAQKLSARNHSVEYVKSRMARLQGWRP